MARDTPAATPPAPMADVARRAARAWRIALVAYLLPLTVATHWPRLGFGGGGEIDKFVHFLAFGVLAWIWIHARPLGSAAVGFLIAVAWVYLDERTQALEILGRTFSLHDMVAGWIGVAMAGGIYAADRVRGPEDHRAIRALAYADARSWAIAALATLASIAVLGAATLLIVRKEPAPRIAEVLYAIGFGGYLGVIIAAFILERRARARAVASSGRVRRRPAWSALALGTTLASVALSIAYLGLVRLLFGAETPEDLRIEREGFRVLFSGFLVSAVLLSGLASVAVAARLRAPTRSA